MRHRSEPTRAPAAHAEFNAASARRSATRGRDGWSVRAFNERRILSLLRQDGALARAEIARRTGLSAQTVSVIARNLERDGLIMGGAPVRGKVGQPSKPMSIAPDGAYALGVKVGRRSVDAIAMNMAGEVIGRVNRGYCYPTPEPIREFIVEAIQTLPRALPKTRHDRIAGVGIAIPFFLWDWGEHVGDAAHDMEAWRNFDLARAVEETSPYPVYVENDMSAACGAELMFGQGRTAQDFLYFFVGSFIGGGLALDGALYRGLRGNAGAVGPMPVTLASGRSGQLLDVASLFVLEDAVRAIGLDPQEVLKDDTDWVGFDAALESWIDASAREIARATISASALLDLPMVVIEGGFPRDVKRRLVSRIEQAIDQCDLRGVHRPSIAAGLVGLNARAVGGACLPLLQRFLLDGRRNNAVDLEV